MDKIENKNISSPKGHVVAASFDGANIENVNIVMNDDKDKSFCGKLGNFIKQVCKIFKKD